MTASILFQHKCTYCSKRNSLQLHLSTLVQRRRCKAFQSMKHNYFLEPMFPCGVPRSNYRGKYTREKTNFLPVKEGFQFRGIKHTMNMESVSCKRRICIYSLPPEIISVGSVASSCCALCSCDLPVCLASSKGLFCCTCFRRLERRCPILNSVLLLIESFDSFVVELPVYVFLSFELK